MPLHLYFASASYRHTRSGRLAPSRTIWIIYITTGIISLAFPRKYACGHINIPPSGSKVLYEHRKMKAKKFWRNDYVQIVFHWYG